MVGPDHLRVDDLNKRLLGVVDADFVVDNRQAPLSREVEDHQEKSVEVDQTLVTVEEVETVEATPKLERQRRVESAD